MQDKKNIRKHPLIVRIFHYILVFSFLPLAATGVMLSLQPFADATMGLIMRIHVIAGLVLSVNVLAFFVLGHDRAVLFTYRAIHYNKNDMKWMAILGGYPQKFLLRKEVAVPPMGKYNTGQKIFGLAMIVGVFTMILTGWVLWGYLHTVPHTVLALFGTVHLLAGWFLTLFLLVHIAMGLISLDDFKAMFGNGKVSCATAQKHSPYWFGAQACEKEE